MVHAISCSVVRADLTRSTIKRDCIASKARCRCLDLVFLPGRGSKPLVPGLSIASQNRHHLPALSHLTQTTYPYSPREDLACGDMTLMPSFTSTVPRQVGRQAEQWKLSHGSGSSVPELTTKIVDAAASDIRI